jgi:hypothetical protein
MTIATDADIDLPPPHPLAMPLVGAALCVALADWLFYNNDAVGLSFALFLAVLGIVAVTINRTRATRPLQTGAGIVFVAALLALIEEVDLLSTTLAVLATTLFVMVMTSGDLASWKRLPFEIATAPFRGPFRLVVDLLSVAQRLRQYHLLSLKVESLVAWIVPVVLLAVFLFLFAQANPLIEHGLMWFDVRFLLQMLDPWRIAFWILIACLIWPLVLRRVRTRRAAPPRLPEDAIIRPSDLDLWFGAGTISVSLILFNALFALQSVLDLAYLWGGLTLPDGMSHAEYAHRGAYPLVATALLAGGFALIAMRPNGPAQHSRLVRPLVLLWTGQNLLLVISSILRLDLYVAAYSLTYLRLAAFIWMLLVAAGLISMLLQMQLRKSNAWLFACNLATLTAVLYGCCFLNAPQLVASYNLAHSREVSGAGPALDVNYIRSLGPQALPVIEVYLSKVEPLRKIAESERDCYWQRSAVQKNWRAWSWRSWRLGRYLAKNPFSPDLPDGKKG